MVSVISIIVMVLLQNITGMVLESKKDEFTATIFELQRLNVFLREKYNDHLLWANDLIESIVTGRRFEGQLEYNKTSFAQWYYSFSGSPEYWDMDDDRKKIFDAMGQVNVDMHNSARIIHDVKINGKKIDIYRSETKSKLGEMKVLFNKYINLNIKIMHDKEERYAYYNSFKLAFDITMSVIITISVSILGFKIIRSIISNHEQFAVKFDQLAQGNLDTVFETISTNEYGTLAMRFNDFVKILRNVIESLKLLIEELAKDLSVISQVSAEFSSNAQKQSNSAEGVGSAIMEVNAGMESINENVGAQSRTLGSFIETISLHSMSVDRMKLQLAQSASHVHRISDEASAGDRLISTMNKSLKKMAESAEQVTGVFEIVNSISEQINLLSLNASIEAARAGSGGRGFAVVAEEIAKLADKTTSGIREVEDFITKNKTETRQALDNVNETVVKIKGILAGVNAIENMMKEFTAIMEEQVAINEGVMMDAHYVKNNDAQINTAIAEQNASIYEIERAILDVGEISQSNAEGARTISMNISLINDMMKGIMSKIDYFRSV
jgi:methyl-accepting chemotaxis protein